MSVLHSEYRHDPLQKRWVIIASERGKRPIPVPVPEHHEDDRPCPFCPGEEDQTPPEILRVPAVGSDSRQEEWRVRVVPNKFPVLRVEGEVERQGEGMYDRMRGVGAHEVVIETPDHHSQMADRNSEDVAEVLKVYRDRLIDLENDLRFKYILVFKNHGIAAGASLAHSHSQIIATTVTPRTIAMELTSCRDHYTSKERCLICDLIQQEIADEKRIFRMDDRFIAFCPYASRFPFEVFIAPRFHQHDYALTSDRDLQGLASMLQNVLSRLKRGLDDPPYNFILHSAPNCRVEPRRPHYWETIQFDFHWHIELLPRLTRVAGFEWGSGFYINPTPPEKAAEILRDLD